MPWRALGVPEGVPGFGPAEDFALGAPQELWCPGCPGCPGVPWEALGDSQDATARPGINTGFPDDLDRIFGIEFKLLVAVLGFKHDKLCKTKASSSLL